MPQVITMGEALIDFVPHQVECSLQEVSDFHRAPGGAPANLAVGLTRLGIETGFMGKIGDDAFGHFLKQTFLDNNVDISQLVLTSRAMTTLAFVSLHSDGERDFAFYRKPGADMLYRIEEIDTEYLLKSNIFHIGSISLIDEPVKSTTKELVRYARNNNIFISFDPNLRPPLWPTLKDAEREIKNVLSEVDIIKINEDELTFLTGVKVNEFKEISRKDINKLLQGSQEIYNQGPELVITTLGARGCFYFNGSNYSYIEGIKTEAIDTTGAGDGFAAAFLSKIVKYLKMNYSINEIDNKIMKDILAFSNKVGAIVTTVNGGIPSLPTLLEVNNYNLG